MRDSGVNAYDVLLVSAGFGAVTIAGFAGYSYFIQTDEHNHLLDHGGSINPGSTIHGHVEEDLGSPTETVIIVDEVPHDHAETTVTNQAIVPETTPSTVHTDDHIHAETTQPVPAPVATASPNQAVDSHYADGHTHDEVIVVAPQPAPIPQPQSPPVDVVETIPPTIAPPPPITPPAG